MPEHIEHAPLELRVPIDTRARLRHIIAVVTALAPVRFARTYWAEILTAIAFIAGWLLVTAGLASLADALPSRVAERVAAAVWLLSLGALAISLGGWKMLRDFVRDGLYALVKAP